ncbi:MAG: aminodeoxychorismate/anthranilate synthase component II [Bacteroidales bacterium]|jgi:anthranilate synthase component 2
MKNRILIVDNYDSFTYNLYHLIKELGYLNIEVLRNDRLSLDDIVHFDKIILSPGPGIPSEAGLLCDIIRGYASEKSMLGVCLGHQAIAEVFGAQLMNLKEVFHGVATPVRIVCPDHLYDGLPDTFEVGRYHSWIVNSQDFPSSLEVTAEDENGSIMSLRHREYDVRGIQFHPESVLTPCGSIILGNWLKRKKITKEKSL